MHVCLFTFLLPASWCDLYHLRHRIDTLKLEWVVEEVITWTFERNITTTHVGKERTKSSESEDAGNFFLELIHSFISLHFQVNRTCFSITTTITQTIPRPRSAWSTDKIGLKTSKTLCTTETLAKARNESSPKKIQTIFIYFLSELGGNTVW